MTSTDALTIQQAAARAALAVSGVAELQPSLGQRLAGAAARIRRAAGASAVSTAGGVQAHRAADPGGWNIEVRCVVHGDRRALDVARDVHDQVRAAITSHMAWHTPPGTVRITVTVTGITGPHPVTPSDSRSGDTTTGDGI